MGSLVMYFTISMYLIACIALHVIGIRYQVGNSGGGTAAAEARIVWNLRAVCGVCGGGVVQCGEGGVLLVWWCVMV
jgi:hypothetical protein